MSAFAALGCSALGALALIAVWWMTRDKDTRHYGSWSCPFCNHTEYWAQESEEALAERIERSSKHHLNKHNIGRPL